MSYTIAKTYIHNTVGTYIYDVLNDNTGSKTYDITVRGQSMQKALTNGLVKFLGDHLTTTVPPTRTARACAYLVYNENVTTGIGFVLGIKTYNANGFTFLSDTGCVEEHYNDNTGVYASCAFQTASVLTATATSRYPFTDPFYSISVDIPCLPLFGSEQRAEDYVTGVNISLDDALNIYEPETEPEGELFEVYNTGQRGTWSLGDIVTDVSTPFYRWFRVKLATTQGVDGRLAFYKQGLSDGVIKLIPVLTASVVFCEYSTNGSTWEEWTGSGLPFDYIYGERTNELGTFIYATRTGLNGTDGAPIFDDEATALGWVNHDPNVDITDAENYGDLGNRYPIGNKTGENETNTTMGTASNFKSHFTQKYILDSGDVVKISNALFDTTNNIFDDIKTGLKMFGERVIDSVCSLVFFPIDLTSVFTRLSSQSYIFFGGYQYPPQDDPTTIQVYKLLGYDGYIDLGTVTIEPTYPEGDYRNTSQFCKVSIFLPYVGLTELSYEKYVGKTLKVRYYIDLNTGGCLVCLLCNDGDGYKLYDYVNGQIGTQVPITITDYSSYAQAELRNISNLASSTTGFAMSGATAIGGVNNFQNATSQKGIDQALGDITTGALGSVSGVVNMEKAIYDISTTNINNFKTTKGGSGAIGNQYLPQYVYLVFEYIETEETPNLLQLEGRPSNRSGSLDSFSGYLEVDSVKLSCSYATENEKKEIEQLLNTGIYI